MLCLAGLHALNKKKKKKKKKIKKGRQGTNVKKRKSVTEIQKKTLKKFLRLCLRQFHFELIAGSPAF